MSKQPLHHRLRILTTPKRGSKQRIKEQLFQRIDASAEILEVRDALTPAKDARARVWERILDRIAPQESVSILDTIRDMLTPPESLRLFAEQRIFTHLAPPPQAQFAYVRTKWVASALLAAMMIYISPVLFLAPTTKAKNEVLLIPTAGVVRISVGDMWQQVDSEIVLEPGVRIRTEDGQATIAYRDDAVVRLDENSMVIIHDTAEHLGAPAPELRPTFTLAEGRIWAQGLLPTTVRGMTIATSFGHVTVNEGSLSIDDQDEVIDIKVWDRRSLVSHSGEKMRLVAGEQTQLRQSNALLAKKIPDVQFTEDWPQKNLARDAVHRRYIAHLQHERRAAIAGILPTSTLYPVKRVAEHMDMLMTFNEEDRVQKRLDQANTRLNEAAALIVEGEAPQEIAESLSAFEGALLELSSGTGGDTVAKFLIKQSVAETIADIAASLPGDEGYVLKETVLKTTASLSDELIDTQEVQTVLFADAMEILNEAVELGEEEQIAAGWHDIQQYLSLLDSEEEPLDPVARKEAETLLARLAETVDAQREDLIEVNPDLLDDIVAFLPEEEQQIVLQLSEEHVARIIDSVLERVYAYKMHRSRQNQLLVELGAISGHNEEGRLLRALHRALPEGSKLTDNVRRELVRLRWQKAGEMTNVQTGADEAI